MTTGWTCPVCNKGNAPHADKCGHCAEIVISCAPPPHREHVLGLMDWACGRNRWPPDTEVKIDMVEFNKSLDSLSEITEAEFGEQERPKALPWSSW